MTTQYTPAPAPLRRRRWTHEENDRLRAAVQSLGTRNDWDAVAALVGTRKGWQCRERWNHHLRPGVSNAEWTDAEDILLLSKVIEFGRKWKSIAGYLPGRTSASAKNRYHLLIKYAPGAPIHVNVHNSGQTRMVAKDRHQPRKERERGGGTHADKHLSLRETAPTLMTCPLPRLSLSMPIQGIIAPVLSHSVPVPLTGLKASASMSVMGDACQGGTLMPAMQPVAAAESSELWRLLSTPPVAVAYL